MVVDIIFGFDILIIFFSAFYDEEFQLIDNFNGIARNYIFGWFFFDLLAIMPFEELSNLSSSSDDIVGQSSSGGGDVNQLVRIMKLGRM